MSKHFLVKLISPRPTFAEDMSDQERSIMRQHGAYWRELMAAGTALLFGPVLDPAGVYGVGIVEADTAETVRSLIEKDPSKTLLEIEFYPMLAVVPTRG